MLPAVVSVVVLLATGDPGDGSTPAIERSLHAALGSDAVVTVRATTTPATDEALATTAASEHTTLLGVVSWGDQQRRVTIRFYHPPTARWTDREIRFDPADAATERGRTVGFALASMVADEPHVTREPAVVAASAPSLALPAGTAAEAPLPPAPPRPLPYGMALDASAAATGGVGGYAGGLGGVFAFRLTLAGAVSARVALGARFGEIAPAQATSRIITGALGVAWQPWLDAQHRWSAGGRASALLLRHELVHFSDDDPQSVHSALYMPGLEVAFEGAFRVIDAVSLIAAAGSEVAFGKNDVYLHGLPVASVPPFRLFTEAGFRVAF